MILYSVTVSIEPEILEEWLVWMRDKHIPAVMETGLFLGHKMYRLLNEEGGGLTFNVQYFTESLGKFEEYLNNHAPALIQEHNEKFKDKHVAFRTILEEII